MSDIVLGAIIGLGGGVVGAVIGALSSYLVTKRQLDALSRETQMQLDFQKTESRKERLIEARSDFLLSLRASISEWIQCSTQQTNMTIRLSNAFEKYEKDSVAQLAEVENYKLAEKNAIEATSRLDILRFQISDATLNAKIGQVIEKQSEVSTKRMPLLRIIQNHKSLEWGGAS